MGFKLVGFGAFMTNNRKNGIISHGLGWSLRLMRWEVSSF